MIYTFFSYKYPRKCSQAFGWWLYCACTKYLSNLSTDIDSNTPYGFKFKMQHTVYHYKELSQYIFLHTLTKSFESISISEQILYTLEQIFFFLRHIIWGNIVDSRAIIITSTGPQTLLSLVHLLDYCIQQKHWFT